MKNDDFDIFDMPIGRVRPVRTRFAPSPTGMLHIGGARTALYNYLFAKRHGGQFLIRVEDTDTKRSTPEFTAAIFHSLNWLGLSADEAPVYQSAQTARHAQVANDLLKAGKAYRCYCTQAELEAKREYAAANHLAPRYDRTCRDRTDTPDLPYTIRLKVPLEGTTVVDDLVQGIVRVNNKELDDMIILRADGTPTYLLAVVVDDHDTQISHVIRGDDHLTNTFRQVQIYNAMKWSLPQFAHIPLIHGPDGKKLSKRNEAPSVMDFEKEGYLPEALTNYLLRLGWGYGDTEIISRNEVIKIFDIADIGKSPARLDHTKLLHLNGVYMRQMDDNILCRIVERHFEENRANICDRIRKAMPTMKERAKTIVELCNGAEFLITRPAATAPSDEDILVLYHMFQMLRDRNEEFTTQTPHLLLHQYELSSGLKLGKIAKPLRLALTGRNTSPPIDAVMYALGKEECFQRLVASLAERPKDVLGL